MSEPLPPSSETVAGAFCHLRQPRWVCLLLFLLVLGVFSPALRNSFVNLDDPATVYQSPEVVRGVTLTNLQWAFDFKTVVVGHWVPLTTISHMVDCQLYGLQPWGHHLTNILLHGGSSVLLFLLLWRMTGASGRSAFVAACFAIHPLRVESVAWVTERKDVLSGFFFMLTLLAYVRYTERPSVPRYLPVPVLLTLGLLSKSMLVTVPFLLLLLDYWPLGRLFRPAEPGRGPGPFSGWLPVRSLVLWEKLPLLALAVVFSVRQMHAVEGGLDPVPMFLRFGNAVVTVETYLSRMLWPAGLAAIYPFPKSLPLALVLGCAALLAAFSALAVAGCRRYPFLFTGWFWYVGMLVPTIGLIQAGPQPMADRYTYLPMIGVFIVLAWGGGELAERLQRVRVAAVSAVVALACCAVLTIRQIGFWSDSITLFRHAAEVVDDNWFAYFSLGHALASVEGKLPAAVAAYRIALRLNPDFVQARYDLGNALMRSGRFPEAIEEYRQVIRRQPGFMEAYYNLGTALLKIPGGSTEAQAQFETALRLRPDFEPAQQAVRQLRGGGAP